MKAIRRIVRDVPSHWVGDGFPVRSLFSYSEGSEFDPFIHHAVAPCAQPRRLG